jgi:hypothetical protein
MIIYFIEGNKILKKILEKAYKTQFKKEDNKNENMKNRKKEIESKIKKKERSKFEKKKTTTYKNKNAKILENSDEEKIEKNESPYLKKKSKNDTTKRINKSKSYNIKINCPPKFEKKITKDFSIKNFSSKNTFINSPSMKNTHLNSKNSLFSNKNKNKEFKNILKIDLKKGEKGQILNNIKKNYSTKNKVFLKIRQKDIIRKNNKFKKIKNKNNSFERKNLNEEEINNLDYDTAIRLDKRTFMQYYWSLLKKKQIILFTFFTMNDYNIKIIKISFFVVSFALYLTINGFFFSDETMHKIYEDNGKYNLLYQIPPILYSSLISFIIKNILKYFSLSEKSILELRKEKSIINIESQKTEQCLKIKLIIYFIISFLFMAFFWYFISSFCAVYNNTQIILLKNTLFSFSLSMLYPFGYVLLPGLFRIPALRAKNKDKKLMYQLSKYIALI